MQIFVRAKVIGLLVDPVANRTGDDEAEFLAPMRHRADARMRAPRQNAESRLEHAGQEVTGQILQRQPHFRVFNRIALRAPQHDARLRPLAKPRHEKAEVFLQRRSQVNGVNEARAQLPVLDLADGARRHLRQLRQAADRQLAAETQRAQALADALGLITRACRFRHSSGRGLRRHFQTPTMSSRKGSSGSAVSVSSKCPHFGQQNRRSTTSGWTFIPAPGNVATATVESAADFFQPQFADANRCEHAAQQMLIGVGKESFRHAPSHRWVAPAERRARRSAARSASVAGRSSTSPSCTTP